MAGQGKIEEVDYNVVSGNLSGVTPPPYAPAPASSDGDNMSYNSYPPALAKYEDVVLNPVLFMATLHKLHAAMGTKFMIPTLAGRKLDLHKLFVEVTSRGGVQKVLHEKKWKEVTATFSFSSSTTNTTYILRKHYFSFLHHYEQVYYFRAKGWIPAPQGSWRSTYAMPIAIHGGLNTPPTLSQAPCLQPSDIIRPAESFQDVDQGSNPSLVTEVTGVIDGKFESGYLVTVNTNNGTLRGVLYHVAPTSSGHTSLSQGSNSGVSHPHYSIATPPVMNRPSRKRKTSENRKRDPNLPKSKRSSYNFFFAEEYARLKPTHGGIKSDISTIIAETWTRLTEDEKAVYKKKAAKDKERYKREKFNYREKLKIDQVIIDAVPIQQRLPYLDDEDVDEEGDDEFSMSVCEYKEENEEPVENRNVEMSEKDELGIVQERSEKEAAEAHLMLSMVNETNDEEEQEVKDSNE